MHGIPASVAGILQAKSLLAFLALFWISFYILEQITGILLKSAGRVLLRLKDYQLKLLGVEDEKQQQEILQDLLLLKVQEEISELSDICSGEPAKWLHLQFTAELYM